MFTIAGFNAEYLNTDKVHLQRNGEHKQITPNESCDVIGQQNTEHTQSKYLKILRYRKSWSGGRIMA